jgi:hypothetical protein
VEGQIEPRWRKSSYSGNGGSDCVEVTTRHPRMIIVRDSKNPDGVVLTISLANWACFTEHLRTTG